MLTKSWGMVAALTLAWAHAAPSQERAGLGTARVTLVAHAPARGSIQSVSDARETSRTGNVREASVTLRISANAGYQLIVRQAGGPSLRLWVRGANGLFQELTAGSAVIVARDEYRAGEWQREVQYRVEMPESGEALQPLPVRYEIAINPSP